MQFFDMKYFSNASVINQLAPGNVRGDVGI